MVELYINNMQAVVSDEFKATITQENSFLTEQAEYANNIVLSLLNPLNAKIYKYINRHNGHGRIEERRKAVIKVDNKVIISGTEIIINNTDTTVEIQIASGASEINYIVGEDLNLRDLDLGVCEGFINHSGEAMQQEANSYLAQQYPQRKWQALPVEYPDSTDVANNYTITLDGALNAYPALRGNASSIIPQPYFSFIIEKVFAALGYTVIYNAIADTPALSQMYMVHTIETMEYAKMLPEWTVYEFLEEIEFQFGCSFVVNSDTKTVKLLYQYDRELQGRQDEIVKVDLEVIDEYKRTPDEDNRVRPQNSNIDYDLGSEDYYKYAYLPESVRSRPIVDMRMTLQQGIIWVRDNQLEINGHPDNYYASVIWTFTDSPSKFIIAGTGNARYLKKVAFFDPCWNNSDSTEIDRSVKFIPCPMTSNVAFPAGHEYHGYYLQYPISGIVVYNEDYENLTIEEMIEGQSNKSGSLNYNTMRLAIYTGVKELDWLVEWEDARGNYPISYVESLAEYMTGSTYIERHFGIKDLNPFRLSYLNEHIYSKVQEVDTTLEHVFKFIKPSDFDIRAVFNIRNKEYLCAKIEMELNADGFELWTTGYFYPKVASDR